MKKTLLAFLLAAAPLCVFAQLTSYIPTEGLAGWWPFNGNANDESGNENNGTVTGATLTTDRFGLSNRAFSFDGISNQINVEHNDSYNFTEFTISCWALSDGQNINLPGVISKCEANNSGWYIIRNTNLQDSLSFGGRISNNNYFKANDEPISTNQWFHIVGTFAPGNQNIYVNGLLVGSDFNSGSVANTSEDIRIGFKNGDNHWGGKIDDIGIWNRALDQQEITNLYNAVNCASNTTINTITNTLNQGSTSTFNASTSDPNPSYVWQSDFGQGFQTLNNFGNYSGTNTGTLNIANVQLPNHTQPIRVITTSGNCIDTSNVSIILIADTCINNVTDTTFISVTDTLIINSTITSLSPPNNSNTIVIFPNPTNDHITIDYGNFMIMTGYQLKIENSLGQQVFQTNITQQSDYLNLTTLGGNGLYFVHIIDPQGNTIDIRKIVLQ